MLMCALSINTATQPRSSFKRACLFEVMLRGGGAPTEQAFLYCHQTMEMFSFVYEHKFAGKNYFRGRRLKLFSNALWNNASVCLWRLLYCKQTKNNNPPKKAGCCTVAVPRLQDIQPKGNRYSISNFMAQQELSSPFLITFSYDLDPKRGKRSIQ